MGWKPGTASSWLVLRWAIVSLAGYDEPSNRGAMRWNVHVVIAEFVRARTKIMQGLMEAQPLYRVARSVWLAQGLDKPGSGWKPGLG